MIKVTATSEGEATNVSSEINAGSIEYMDEVIAIIKALMGNMRKNAPELHFLVIHEMAEHPEILLGDEGDIEQKTKGILNLLKKQKERAM